LDHSIIKISGREHYVGSRSPFICITVAVDALTFVLLRLQHEMARAASRIVVQGAMACVARRLSSNANFSDGFLPLLRSSHNGAASGSDQ
jgi:hypothetical protein